MWIVVLFLIYFLNLIFYFKKIKLYYFHVPVVSLYWGCLLFILLGVPIDYFFYEAKYSHNYWVVYVYLSFLFLGLIVGSLFGWGVAFSSRYSIPENTEKSYTCFFLSLYFFGLVSISILYVRMPEIPLFSSDVHATRISALTGLGYNYKIAIYSLYLGSFGLALHGFKVGKRGLALLPGVIAFFAIMPTANRIDSLFIIFMLGMAYFYMKSSKSKLSYSFYMQVSLLGVGVLFISAVFQFARHYGIYSLASVSINELLNFSLNGLYHRFWVQLENLSYLLDKDLRIAKFSTFLNDLLMAVPGSGVNKTSGVLLKEEVGLSFKGGGITPTFIGEGIVQFGYLGAGFYCFFIGLVVSLMSPVVTRVLGSSSLFFPFLFVGSFFLHGIATSTLVAVFVHSIAPVALILAFTLFIYFVLNTAKKLTG